MPHLVVIYGAPLTGKTSLARALALRLGDKSAIVSVDALFHDAISLHDRDVASELEMVYTQARLLVANYLKNGYNTVLEGAFAHDQHGNLQARDREIDQILALMRNLAPLALTVRLTAGAATLRARHEAADSRSRDAGGFQGLDWQYRQRYGEGALELSTEDRSPEELAAEVLDYLQIRRTFPSRHF